MFLNEIPNNDNSNQPIEINHICIFSFYIRKYKKKRNSLLLISVSFIYSYQR